MKQSAGILVIKRSPEMQVFLVHPGGPFWKNKDLGAWTIPKGEINVDEDPLAAAKREFMEETGTMLSGKFIQLSPVKQKAGKLIIAWVVEADIDAARIISNSFEIEWPPKSGKMKSFPEVDKAGWFTPEEAKQKINPGQVGLIEEVERM